MREIKHIVLHCTATQPQASVQSILNYWRNVLNWKNVGYHYLIDPIGAIHQLAEESTIANGVAGYNANSVHISYIGGIDKFGKPLDTRTPQQALSMLTCVVDLIKKYPNAKVLGHCDFPKVAKACPSFNVQSWLIANKLGDKYFKF